MHSTPPPHLRALAAAFIFTCAALLAGCPQNKPAGQPPTGPGGPATVRDGQTTAVQPALVIWADPGLGLALNGLKPAYQKAARGDYGVVPVERGVRNAWAKSGDLAGNLQPDVVLFAGQDDYLLLLTNKRIDESSARTFAGDRLIVLKPLGSTFTGSSLFDLSTLHFKELAAGDPEQTLVGFFTNQALISDGALPRVQARLKTYTDTNMLPGLPLAHEGCLSIGLASQAGNAARVLPLLLIDAGLHEPLQYKAAAVAGKGSDAAVMAFLRWLAEDPATQQALAGYGLLDRASSLASVPQKPDLPAQQKPDKH